LKQGWKVPNGKTKVSTFNVFEFRKKLLGWGESSDT
jgi:hypothetical protein